MAITTDQLKKLRDLTGLSVMQCKKALEEAGGDMDKAVIILRKKSGEAASKKADRTLGAGAVQAYVHSNATVGVIVELSSETDFVSNNPEFKTLAYDIAMHAAAMNPEFVRMEDITEDAKNSVKEVLQKEVADKPANMQEKILQGKLDAYFKDRVLLDQPFVKNPDMTIKALIDAASHKFGEKIELRRFARFQVNK